jgi:D-alanyl-lipoteichoic acid acyltransferase DltB (MBOAT superfamily)
MAIGAARVMGFATMKNFDRPYSARSVGEFWHRWHISLSSWFRDYLYIPLGGSRVAPLRWGVNILIVFLLSGLWHGAAWTFIIWGGLHGIFLIGERLIQSVATHGDKSIPDILVIRVLQRGVTFAAISFAWIFFRANSLQDAWFVVTHLFDGLQLTALNLFGPGDLNRAVVLIALLLAVQHIRRSSSALTWLRTRPRWMRWAVYAALVLGCVNMRPEFNSGFIYLNF